MLAAAREAAADSGDAAATAALANTSPQLDDVRRSVVALLDWFRTTGASLTLKTLEQCVLLACQRRLVSGWLVC